MPISVLQPVERRRRRRRRRRAPVVALILAVAAAAVAGSLAALRYWPSNGTAAPTAPAPRPVAATKPVPPPKLLTATRPLESHRFRPALTARSAILVDARSGAVLWALRPHARRPIASTTKIMTAVLALERFGPQAIVEIDPFASRAAPFREGLRPGERVRAWKLLYGLMLFSGNDDAVALAIATAGSRGAFIHAMNAKARDLGLSDTHFSTPSGVVDRRNRSSAWDLAALGRYAMAKPRFRAIVRTRRMEVKWAPPTYAKLYINKNRLLWNYPGANGIKTGWTTVAGHCLVASARRNGVELIAVVLGSADGFGDARRLLDFGFRIRG